MIDLLKIGELCLQSAVDCLVVEFVFGFWHQGQCGDDRLGVGVGVGVGRGDARSLLRIQGLAFHIHDYNLCPGVNMIRFMSWMLSISLILLQTLHCSVSCPQKNRASGRMHVEAFSASHGGGLDGMRHL